MLTKIIRVGIVGATGYSGSELIDILLRHPQARISCLGSRAEKPVAIADVFPKFKDRLDLDCCAIDPEELAARCDLVFFALPHTAAMEYVPALLKAGKRVIDLSADYRFRNVRLYEKYYQVAHKDSVNLKDAVYGLPELYRQKIRQARLIANPGCYPTAAILALAPVVANESVALDSIIIDAKSGVSGAGKKLSQEFLFSEVNENFSAYKVNCHQHSPEIDQVLSRLASTRLKVTFVPHLLPLNRGILETIYLKPVKPSKTKSLIAFYKKFYKNEPFVRIRAEGDFPKLKDVSGTNYCDIGIQADGDTVILIAAIDNLVKGAAGQAVQNMNIMCQFPETAALL